MSKDTDFEKHIKAQLLRLSHLLGYPTEPMALRDYISALAVAQTQEGATRVVDALIQELLTRDCPTAAVIRIKAWGDRDRREAKPIFEQPRHAHCPDCQDFGIRESISVDDFNSVASRCDCVAGQQVKREWIQRVNDARVKLRRLFPAGNPLSGIAARSNKPKLTRVPDEIYHGQF